MAFVSSFLVFALARAYEVPCATYQTAHCDDKCAGALYWGAPGGSAQLQLEPHAVCTRAEVMTDYGWRWQDGVSCTCNNHILAPPDGAPSGHCYIDNPWWCNDPGDIWDGMRCTCEKAWIPSNPTWTQNDIEIAYDYICGDGTTDPNEECDQGGNNTDDVIYGLPCDMSSSKAVTRCDTSCHTFYDCTPN